MSAAERIFAPILLALFVGYTGVTLIFGDFRAMSDAPLGEVILRERLWHAWFCVRQFDEAWRSFGLLQAMKLVFFWGGAFISYGNIADFWLLAYPLAHLFSFPLSFNAQTPLVLMANALAAYFVTLQVSRTRISALLAGVAFGLNPWALYLLQRGSVREALMAFALLFAGALWKVCQGRPRALEVVAMGFWLAASAVFYWFYGLYCLLLLAVVCLWTLLRGERFPWRPVFVALLLCINFVLPFLPPALQIVKSQTHVAGTYGQMPPSPAEIARYDRGAFAFPRFLTDDSMVVDYLWRGARVGGQPVVLLMLAACAAVLCRRAAGFWVLTLVTFYLMSLGNHVKLASGFYPSAEDAWPAPYMLVQAYLPMFSHQHHPDRAALLAVGALAVLAGMGAQALGQRVGKLGAPLVGVLAAEIFLCVLFAQARPGQLPDWEIPPVYRMLAAENSGCLIELPFTRATLQPGHEAFLEDRPRIYQIIHGRTMITGLEASSDPFYQWLDAFSRGSLDEGAPDPGGLRAMGLRWVILHEVLCAPPGRAPQKRYEHMRGSLRKVLGVAPREYREISTLLSRPREESWGYFRVAVFELPSGR